MSNEIACMLCGSRAAGLIKLEDRWEWICGPCLIKSKDQLQKLIQNIKTIVPYVLATISPHNCFEVPGRPGWMAVHKGRADSSCNQLAALLRMAEEP